MMWNLKSSRLSSSALWLGGLASGATLLLTTPAYAHHAMGGRMPSNAWEGFMSGLAHPIIGLDHAAFVVAIGLLAALLGLTWTLPIAFVLASLAGTGLHIMRLDIPGSELFVAASVLLFGLLLTLQHRPNAGLTLALATLAGVFHGYAYGESIVGAEMTPLFSYLAGFAVIQLGVALLASRVARQFLQPQSDGPVLPLQFAGFTVAGIGLAFLAKSVGL